jgi:hypothetical protein
MWHYILRTLFLQIITITNKCTCAFFVIPCPPHIFVNTQHCRKLYITHPPLTTYPSSFTTFIDIKNYWYYTEAIKFHSVLSQRKP